MKKLQEKILQCAWRDGEYALRIDSFLNHQMDVALFEEIGREFYRRFKDEKINKLVTVESSGIGIACVAAQFFKTPVVFAKKQTRGSLSDDVYTTPISSPTSGRLFDIVISKEFLAESDRILLIDDYLAGGAALAALRDLGEQAGCAIVGAGIVIEKAYQGGGQALREDGLWIESLAIIDKMDTTGITFRE